MTSDQTATFPIDVYLCVISSDPKFLVKKNTKGMYEFPNAALEKSKTPKTIASDLLFNLTKLTENWTAILSIGVSEASMKEGYTNSIILLYACYIAETTRISGEDVCWIDYNRLKSRASPLTLFLAQECIYKKV
jgi:hypothetical protein